MKEIRRKAMIADVMENFDFEEVRKVMLFLIWKWDGAEVPSIYSLMKEAEKLLEDVTRHNDKERHEASTGGLRAIFDEYGNLELLFELENSESFDCDYDEEGNFNYK